MESDHTSFPTGKRAVICQYGEDPMDAIDNHLVIEDQDAPGPASLKAVDCLIAVKSAAVGWVDLIMSSGQYQHMADPPYKPGLEYSGEIIWAGKTAQEHGFHAGDAVMADGFKTGPRALGQDKKYGGFATYAVAIGTQQGADHVVCTHADHGGIDALRSRVKELTAGRGVDVVYDGVGGSISAASLRCVDFGARYLIVGWAATPFVAKGKKQRGSPNANQLPTNLIMMKGLDVLGCPTVITTHRDTSIRKQRLADSFHWVAEGKLKPYVTETYPFKDLKVALKAKWTSDSVGGCAVHPDE